MNQRKHSDFYNSCGPEQQARWDLAEQTYYAIEQHSINQLLLSVNRAELYALLLPNELSLASAAEKAAWNTQYEAMTELQLRDKVTDVLNFSKHACCESSALFNRLLAGLSPLRFPPPLKNSLPCYEYIESPEYVPVASVRLLSEEPLRIQVDGAVFDVMSFNTAAADLLKLSFECTRGVHSFYSADIPTREIFNTTMPEMVLKQGNWPAFLMFTHQYRLGEVLHSYFVNTLSKINDLPSALHDAYEPLNLMSLLIDLKVDAITSTKTMDDIALEYDQKFSTQTKPTLLSAALAGPKVSCAEYAQKYIDDPLLLETVVYSGKIWCIERVESKWENFLLYLDMKSITNTTPA